METVTLSAYCSPTIQRCTAVVDIRTKPMGISENISSRFEQLAVTRSNAPALIVPGWPAFTFAHLDAQIHALGAHLRQWGCSPGDVIAGVMTDRIALALACISLPASATFAPLAPNLSEDAYIGLLRRLRPKVVALACVPTHPARQAAAVLKIAVVELSASPDGLSASPISIGSGHEAHLGKPVRQDTRWAYLL
ncbi:MAG: hypothetical protein EHM59_07610, partial [Betaproteobacteria bacterium]